MVKQPNTLESKKLLDSKSKDFRKQVIQFGKNSIGKCITFELFERWLNKSGYQLMETDNNWRAIFTSILNYQFTFDVEYKIDCNQRLITVFKLKRFHEKEIYVYR